MLFFYLDLYFTPSSRLVLRLRVHFGLQVRNLQSWMVGSKCSEEPPAKFKPNLVCLDCYSRLREERNRAESVEPPPPALVEEGGQRSTHQLRF